MCEWMHGWAQGELCPRGSLNHLYGAFLLVSSGCQSSYFAVFWFISGSSPVCVRIS